MGSKSLSQEYDFSEGEESPVRSYKPLRSRANIEDTRNNQETDTFVTVEKATDVENGTNSENADAAENIDPNFSRTQRKVVYMCSKYMVDKADQMIKVPKRVSEYICHTCSLKKYNIA